MIVYAIEPYTYVYGQHAVGHKQGKAFPGREMEVVGEWGSDWLEIEAPPFVVHTALVIE